MTFKLSQSVPFSRNSLALSPPAIQNTCTNKGFSYNLIWVRHRVWVRLRGRQVRDTIGDTAEGCICRVGLGIGIGLWIWVPDIVGVRISVRDGSGLGSGTQSVLGIRLG